MKKNNEENKDKSLVQLLNIKGHEILESGSKLKQVAQILKNDFSLYHIQELTFEDESPRKEGFENVLSSLKIDGVSFVYLLLGDADGVSFYFGIVKDKDYAFELELDVDDIGDDILKSSIEGNFRGSKIQKVNFKTNNIKSKISSFTRFAKIDGVPSVNEENEEFQGVDRLVDVMNGDEYGMIILADPLSSNQIEKIENSLYEIYDKLNPLSKKSIQTNTTTSNSEGVSSGDNSSETIGNNDGSSITKTNGTSKGSSFGTNKSTSSSSSSNSSSSSTSKSASDGSNEGTNDGENHSIAEGKSKGVSTSKTTGQNVGKNSSTQISKGDSQTLEFSNKNIQIWLEYIDEVLLKMVKNGKNKGLYYTNIYLLANTKGTLLKLGNTLQALFSGENDNKAHLKFKYITNKTEIEYVKNFQLPVYKSIDASINERLYKLLHSRSNTTVSANWLSTNELSVVAGLPQKEVIGLALKEEVEFGLNIKINIKDEDKLLLGNLVKSGNTTKLNVNINKKELNKHTFIAGVTGSGKTTTCQRILNSADMPYMVIEPAKTEYRILTKKDKDILIFTLGNDNIAPFRLNPFEFFPHENITSKVDMIKASIEAAFDMEAAIPQIIESAIYKCYESYGWDIATSKNTKYKNPFADGVYAFPTLQDLIEMASVVVSEQGFDERLKNDYLGSIRARLQGLLIGSKGLMLNTSRSINFKDLVRKKVILELEEIKNPSEKSLIMGFVLANLNEAVRANYEDDKRNDREFKHITLIEEAHRLLSKYETGDSQNKKQGVETFADMLAEVRKYGEALIIVDQIPNKLTSEVLKNTNTKIIHKLFAKDDKEAVGNTMALNDEQKDFLSNLEVGRVIVSSSGMSKPVQVQIKELVSTTKEKNVQTKDIRKIALQYYADNYKKGLIKGLEYYDNGIPSQEMVEVFLQDELRDGWRTIVKGGEFKYDIKRMLDSYGVTFVRDYLVQKFYDDEEKEEKKDYLNNFLSGILTKNIDRFSITIDGDYLSLKER